MDLQTFLTQTFRSWSPDPPEQISRTQHDVTLRWTPGSWRFVEGQLLYRIERREKIPAWVLVYSGGKTTKTIENLAPSQPHKFRMKVLLKSSAVNNLSQFAIDHFGSEEAVYKYFSQEVENDDDNLGDDDKHNEKNDSLGDCTDKKPSDNFNGNENTSIPNGTGDHQLKQVVSNSQSRPWLESRYSGQVWTATDSEGASVICFCMAVRCGYLKQIQQMLEERPQLLEVINSVNGMTPLITAVRKGDTPTVRLLLSSGSAVDARSSSGQTALQLALYCRRTGIAQLLLEKGADVAIRDLNGLRAEHYAVDSNSLESVQLVYCGGGQLEVKDNRGWTPLFRAVLQGADIEIIEDLIKRGADTRVVDVAGLTIADAARLLKDKSYPRDAVVRLVDPSYPHEQAVTHFTRLTRKIHSMQTLFK
ncbi:hypothetical protein JYU34_019616 [Plutella xylostella]|uniref:Fibronectin type-III domain-containing protein n=1 Tax=Plutella xylostella TaxID=51655 RepID=A0ABQ7PXW1_PLUXY|nr:hypothetical protein JYU34_019616 [Plutella xylostella]